MYRPYICPAAEAIGTCKSHLMEKDIAVCRVVLVVSVSASHTVSREFASRPGHTKDNHKNGTDCLPVWHAMR